MNGNVLGAIITSATTIACLAYTSHRQISTQNRKLKELTERQTEQITAHVSDTAKGGSP